MTARESTITTARSGGMMQNTILTINLANRTTYAGAVVHATATYEDGATITAGETTITTARSGGMIQKTILAINLAKRTTYSGRTLSHAVCRTSLLLPHPKIN